MRTEPQFTIRRMTGADLELALEWAAREGWNPGLHDAACFQTADPHGFLIGCLDEEPIGCISVVAYDATFGFLGLYIVRPEFRGKGYGLALWQAGMAYMGKRNVGLDGVVAQQDNYRKSGFHLAYRNVRYEGRGGGVSPAGVTDLAEISFDALLTFDSMLFPVPRERFLRAWITQPECTARAVIEDGQVAGYGVLRPCRNGSKIGPLLANTTENADRLYQALAAQAGAAPLFLDAPEINDSAVQLAERHGMRRVFETARMYTGTPPPLQMNRIFGVTTFELG